MRMPFALADDVSGQEGLVELPAHLLDLFTFMDRASSRRARPRPSRSRASASKASGMPA